MRTPSAPGAVARVVLAGTLGTAANGQSLYSTEGSTVAISLSWSEVDLNNEPVPNPDGMLEPGERALLRMSESFSNQNTIARFSPSIGTASQGTVRGFGLAWLDLFGFNGAQGSWNVDPVQGFGIQGIWDLVGDEGEPRAGGALLANIVAGQFSPDHLVTTNPVPSLWLGVWTPASFEPRTVRFALAGDPAVRVPTEVIIRISASLAVIASCPYAFGSVSIPVVPAPGVLWFVPLAIVLRRRRAGR